MKGHYCTYWKALFRQWADSGMLQWNVNDSLPYGNLSNRYLLSVLRAFCKEGSGMPKPAGLHPASILPLHPHEAEELHQGSSIQAGLLHGGTNRKTLQSSGKQRVCSQSLGQNRDLRAARRNKVRKLARFHTEKLKQQQLWSKSATASNNGVSGWTSMCISNGQSAQRECRGL